MALAAIGVGDRWACCWRASSTSRGPSCRRASRRARPVCYRLLANKYYVDEIYDALVVRPLVAGLGPRASTAASTPG